MNEVVEHLTLSLHDQDREMDSRASTMRDAWVIRVIRFGSIPIVAASILLMMELYARFGLQWTWGWAGALFNSAVSAICVGLTFGTSFTRRWRPIAFTLLSLILMSNTVIGTVGGEPMLLYIASMLMMLGTGALLPWSKRCQLALNALILLSWAIEMIYDGSLDPIALYHCAGLITSGALSYFTCYVRDRFVKEHEESSRRLRESEAALRQILNANTGSILLTDFQTRQILDVNNHFVTISGYQREELIGKTVNGLGAWFDPAAEQEFFRQLLAGGEVKNLEAGFRTKSGNLLPCLISSAIIELNGRRCLITAARDITELKESQQRLRESEQRFRAMFESTRDAIMIARLSDWKVVEVNDQFLAQTHVRREEVIGKTPDELQLWGNPEEKAAFLKEFDEKGYVEGFEMSKRLGDGRTIPVLVSGVKVRLSGEDYYFGMGRDISALRAAEQKVRDSEESLRRIFDASLDWMAIADMTSGDYLDVNESFVRACGLPREAILGSDFFKLGLWVDRHEWEPFLEELGRRGEVRNARATVHLRSGARVPCLISAVVREVWGRSCCISSVRDISQLSEAQEKLRRSEETFRKIFDTNRDAVAISDAQTHEFIDLNPEFLATTGYTREEVIGQSSTALGLWVSPEQQQSFRTRLMLAGEIRNLPTEFRRKDGTTVHCLTSAVMAEIDGRLCVLSMARDVSELSAAEEKVRKSESMLRAIFDNTRDGISLLDGRTQTIIEVNAGLCRMTGFAREEMIGHTFEDLMPPADPARQEGLRQMVIGGAEVHDFAMTLRDRKGNTFPGLISTARFEFDGRPCTMSVARDISDIAAAEERVRKSEAMLRAIFDNSLDNVALFDLTDQTIVEVNHELSKTIGYTRDEMIGKRMDDLVPRGDPVKQGQFFEMLMRGREVRNWEMNVTSRAGERTFPALVSACIVEINGRKCGLTAARDISDLVRAREAALAASRAKSEFLSIMSHEIRTPMNAILGMADLMGESELNLEQRRYLDTILANGNALLELINSILDLAKVESGRLNLEAVEFNVIELTERAADTLAVRAHEKGVELAVRLAPNLPAMLTGDPHRLRQVLTNLIGNAIKFTKQGEVVVSVARNSDSARPGNFIFSVRDTGIGIAVDKMDHIFSAFTQADSSTTRKFGGSGLGLAIVERLAGLMGGRVWVESEVGKGSTFYFTANLAISATPISKLPVIEDSRMRELRVLVMGEHATSRSIVADLLRNRGCVVAEADGEAAAHHILLSATRDRTPIALIFGDLEMTAGDGCEVLARMRRVAPDAALVMLTDAYGLPAKLRRMHDHNLHHYCTRPIKHQEFYSVCAEALARSAGVKTVAPAQHAVPVTNAVPSSVSDRPLKILLADDSPDNRLLIRAYTKKTAYQLTEAENGQIAVDRFIGGGFDLVLMDIQMPVLDGYTAVRAIRKWEADTGHPHTPIIALTASALEEDVRRAKAAGCDLHVSKPVKKSTLLESVARVMEEVASAPTDDGEAHQDHASAIAMAAIASLPPLPPRADFQI